MLTPKQPIPGAGAEGKFHVASSGGEHHDGAQLAGIDGGLDVIPLGWAHGRVPILENLALPK